MQTCTYSRGPHGLQLLSLMRVQCIPCLLPLQMHAIKPQNCLCFFRHLLHAIMCARLLLGEPRRRRRKGPDVLSKHLVCLLPPMAGGAAHFLCNLPFLKSPSSRLINLTPATCSLKASPTLLLVFHRPTSSWSFESLSTQSGSDPPLLPRWGWDLNVMGAVVRAAQT